MDNAETEDQMTALLIVGLIAACCGVPILVGVGLAKFGPKTIQPPDTAASLEFDQSTENAPPNSALEKSRNKT